MWMGLTPSDHRWILGWELRGRKLAVEVSSPCHKTREEGRGRRGRRGLGVKHPGESGVREVGRRFSAWVRPPQVGFGG